MKPAWRKRAEGSFTGSFLDVVAGRIVLLLRRDGQLALWCLRANGKTAWDRTFEREEVRHYFPYRDCLYVDGAAAMGISIDTGETLVRRDFGDRVLIAPPTPNGPVYTLGDYQSLKGLMGLDPTTLDPRWEWPDAGWVAHGNQLCRYADGAMRFVDLATMRERSVPHAKPLGVHGHGGNLWIHIEERERAGISTVTGEAIWRHAEKEPDYQVGLVYADDVVYCGGRALSAIALKTGNVLWRQGVAGWPARVSAGWLLAGSNSGLVYVLDAATGEIVVSYDLGEKATAIEGLAPNRVVVGTHKAVYCLEWC